MWTDTGGHDFEQAPTGTELGICTKVVDIGTQEGSYEGRVTHKRQVIISWELPNALMTEGEYAGQPFVVSKFYTASLNEKANLRQHLVSWRGREFTEVELQGFDPQNILGKPCMLSLVSNAKGKTIVSAVMAIPKGMPVPQLKDPLVFFSMYPGKFNSTVFEGLSKGIKEMITKSPEYQELTQPKDKGMAAVSGGGAFDDLDDGIPFMDMLGRFHWRIV